MKKTLKLNDCKFMIISAVMILLFSCSSCKRHRVMESLPIEKLFIVEYNYIINSDNYQYIFHVQGFCELGKDFKSSYATYGHDGFYYYNLDDDVPDNIRNKISDILLNYSSDTTFLSPHKNRIYDGNHYQFIIQRNGKNDITIKFEPEFLPKDLLFLYHCLYGNKQDSYSEYGFDRLFKKIEKRIQSDMPSPILIKDTVVVE